MGSFGWKQTSFTLPVCPGSLANKHHDKAEFLDATSFGDIKLLPLMSPLSNVSFMELQEVSYRHIEPSSMLSVGFHKMKTAPPTCKRAEASSCPKYSPGQHLQERPFMDGWQFMHAVGAFGVFSKCQAGGTF